MNVDLDALTEAFEDASAEMNYFVDVETGEIVLVSETLGFIEAGKQRFEMDLTPGRFLAVPVARALDLDDDLDAFLDRVDEELAIMLEQTLDAADSTRRIDALLAPHLEIADDWKRFRRDRLRRRVHEWARQQQLAVES